MKQRSVYIVPGFGQLMINKMFKDFGWNSVKEIEDADLVQFTGGADVSPNYYGEYEHTSTHCDPERDAREEGVFNLAIALGIPMAGICRGGQFLNVMSGGRLYQDVDNHAIHGTHTAFINDKDFPAVINVSSTHHQMMRPNTSPEADCHVLMTANLARKMTHMSEIAGSTKYTMTTRPLAGHVDMEALYYGSTNCLCYQPHPELLNQDNKQCTRIYFGFINKYLCPIEDDGNDESSGDMDSVDAIADMPDAVLDCPVG